MIKTLLAVCLVGAAYAEADADAFYGGLGYGYGHGLGYAGYGYHGVPFGSSTGLDPITQGLDASTQGLVGYGHYYGHHLGKREADADAYYGGLGYGYGLGYAGYGHHGVYAHVPFGSSTGLDPITQGLDASTQGLVGYGHYYGHHLGKREADADAYYGGLGYGYGLGYAGYGHHGVYAAHVPFGSSTGLDPITQGLDASTQGYLGHYGYYGHHLGKREADADAFYGGLGYGYGLHGLGYAGYGHHGVYAAHVPFGSSTGLDPITQGLDASTQGYLGHYGYHY